MKRFLLFHWNPTSSALTLTHGSAPEHWCMSLHCTYLHTYIYIYISSALTWFHSKRNDFSFLYDIISVYDGYRNTITFGFLINHPNLSCLSLAQKHENKVGGRMWFVFLAPIGSVEMYTAPLLFIYKALLWPDLVLWRSLCGPTRWECVSAHGTTQVPLMYTLANETCLAMNTIVLDFFSLTDLSSLLCNIIICLLYEKQRQTAYKCKLGHNLSCIVSPQHTNQYLFNMAEAI